MGLTTNQSFPDSNTAERKHYVNIFVSKFNFLTVMHPITLRDTDDYNGCLGNFRNMLGKYTQLILHKFGYIHTYIIGHFNPSVRISFSHHSCCVR